MDFMPLLSSKGAMETGWAALGREVVGDLPEEVALVEGLFLGSLEMASFSVALDEDGVDGGLDDEGRGGL